MANFVNDRTWQHIERLLPPPKPRRSRYPGRLPIENRDALNGILFVLKTGIPWEELPQELGFGSGITCWRRLREWRQSGVWARLLPSLLAQLNEPQAFNWGRVMVTRNTKKQDNGHQAQQPDWKKTAAASAREFSSRPNKTSPLSTVVARKSA